MTNNETARALQWWKSLSINEQKRFATETHGVLGQYAWQATHLIVEMWEHRGRPDPDPCIPIKPNQPTTTPSTKQGPLP